MAVRSWVRLFFGYLGGSVCMVLRVGSGMSMVSKVESGMSRVWLGLA